MLAGRLLNVISALLNEYKTLNIVPRLHDAVKLAANRAADPNYVNKARDIRAWASHVIHNTSYSLASYDVHHLLTNSQYSTALPQRIGQIIFDGFPDDINLAISSSEANLYLSLATSLLNELTSFVNVASKFKIHPVIIPADMIGFDIFLPRAVFDNKVEDYTKSLSRFASIASYFTELSTGTKEKTDLTYISTTDPVTGIALVIAAATPLLVFYKMVLETAEKQFSLLKTIKEFRNASLSTPSNLDEEIKKIVDANLKQAVDAAIASVPHQVPEERVSEISIAIVKDGSYAVQAIANGARIGVTIETNNQNNLLALPSVGEEKNVSTLLDEIKTLERKVDQALILFGEPAPLLLQNRPEPPQ